MCQYRIEAERNINKPFQADRNNWENALNKNTEDSYRLYLKNCEDHNCKYAKEAEYKIQKFVDNQNKYYEIQSIPYKENYKIEKNLSKSEATSVNEIVNNKPVNQEIQKNESIKKSINAPSLKIGDNYIYESFDYERPDLKILTKRTVVSMGDKVIFSTINLKSKKAKARNLRFNRETSAD